MRARVLGLCSQLAQICLMAFVGVLVASLLTAALIMGLKPHWHFNVCWLIGTVTSATDPVAVVALLKELGLSGLLPVGIEGESLLNDGTALVLFQILLSTVKQASHFCGNDVAPVTAQRSVYPQRTHCAFNLLLFRSCTSHFGSSLPSSTLAIASYAEVLVTEIRVEFEGFVAEVTDHTDSTMTPAASPLFSTHSRVIDLTLVSKANWRSTFVARSSEKSLSERSPTARPSRPSGTWAQRPRRRGPPPGSQSHCRT